MFQEVNITSLFFMSNHTHSRLPYWWLLVAPNPFPLKLIFSLLILCVPQKSKLYTEVSDSHCFSNVVVIQERRLEDIIEEDNEDSDNSLDCSVDVENR